MKFGLASDSLLTSELMQEQAKKIENKLNFICSFIILYLKIMIEFNLYQIIQNIHLVMWHISLRSKQ